ncbi:MAG: cyclophilin-like fold protein [Candidatus Omnitrophota bacterium]
MKIKIKIGKIEIFAALKETATAAKVLAALPLMSLARTWGEEVYFEVPVSAELEAEAQQVVVPGMVCFWTQGKCLALPYGSTPISKGTECRLADRCNVLGELEGDFKTLLGGVRDGDPVSVERI